MKINDNVFGELEYNYSWSKVSNINFNNKEIEVTVLVAGDEEANFEQDQIDAYKLFLKEWDNIQEEIIVSILDYYQNKRAELGFDIELNTNYPKITAVKDTIEYITLAGIKIPYEEVYGGRSIGIRFDCTWDTENGISIRLCDEKVIAVGYQNIAI